MGTPLLLASKKQGRFNTASGQPFAVHYSFPHGRLPKSAAAHKVAGSFLLCGFAFAVFRLQDQHGSNNSNNREQSAYWARPHKTGA
jgi:hypothetical protein